MELQEATILSLQGELYNISYNLNKLDGVEISVKQQDKIIATDYCEFNDMGYGIDEIEFTDDMASFIYDLLYKNDLEDYFSTEYRYEIANCITNDVLKMYDKLDYPKIDQI